MMPRGLNNTFVGKSAEILDRGHWSYDHVMVTRLGFQLFPRLTFDTGRVQALASSAFIS